MALFVEVTSVEKNCQVIINIDHILEIAPLKGGGCTLFFADSAAVGGKVSMKITDSYAIFKQFALQTVSGEMIAERIQKIQDKLTPAPAKLSKKALVDSFDIPKL